MTKPAATLRDALNHSTEAASLIANIEDCLTSWDGENRYASIIANMVTELFELTGYRYIVDSTNPESVLHGRW